MSMTLQVLRPSEVPLVTGATTAVGEVLHANTDAPTKWVLDGYYRGEHVGPVDLKLLMGKHKLRVRTSDGSSEVRIEFTAVTAPPPPPPPPPTGLKTPAQILNLGFGAAQSHFSLQIARNGASSYDTITLDRLANGYTEFPYCYVTPDNWVRLQARMDAPTTSGSHYARSEFREQDAMGVNIKFDALKGQHRMWGVSRISHTPPVKPEVVIAQLHDGDADRCALRTQLIGGVRNLVVRVNGSVNGGAILGPYADNTRVDWDMAVLDGVLYVWVGGLLVVQSKALVQTTNPAGWYFKSGCYNQSNETIDAPTEYCAVDMAALNHSHAS